MKKILVIDGNSIINRAFYGVRALTTKDGRFTNAIFGMINIISKQLDKIKPDYAAVAFDLKAPTFRHELYEHYKEGRHPTPPELLSQFSDAKECLSLMGLHILELPGYEADDIQGTVAKMAHTRQGYESYVLSGDRDLLQLIDDKIRVLLVTNSDTLLMGRDEFYEKYGIAPEAFVDMKALMGDKSDNIPGVAGIGEKTAAQLIMNFGSLDGVYESIDDPRISKGVREKLLRDRDAAYLSRTLATIKTDTPIPESLDDLAFGEMDRAGLYKKFTELELSSFITRFGLSAKDVRESESTPEPEPDFREVGRDEFISLAGEKFALCHHENALYLYNKSAGNIVYKGALEELCELFSENRKIICFDGKKLWQEAHSCGIKPHTSLQFLDISVYAYVINPSGGGGSLPSLASQILGKTVGDSPRPDVLFMLEERMRERICEDGLSEVLFGLEIPLINVLAEIESVGFKIDVAGMAEFADALAQLSDELTERIYLQAGGEFNINSPKQLSEVLFERLMLPTAQKKTKNGYSTNAEVLEELRPYSPIIDDILEYRQVTKLRSTYAAAFINIVDERGRLHTDFKQTLTATGRLSSADPNLQNIPIRTKMGREMRRYFIAEDGYTLVDADYSQIELRLLSHISGDYNMQKTFNEGGDIHRETAAAVFGVSEDEVTDDMRKKAKAVNFGIVYGISGFSLAKDIGTGVQEATRYIKRYLMNYPSVDAYLEKVVEDAKELGYTKTPMGRRRYIPELSSSNGNLRAFGKRVAMNAPIQGAAADIMKLAMINTRNRLLAEGLDAKIVMQVHDELIVEVLSDEAERCKQILAEEMENAVRLDIPLTVDITSGKNWLIQS